MSEAQIINIAHPTLPIHFYKTEKYKTNTISLYIRQPLVEETHTLAALIPQVLLRGSQKYPSAGKLGQALEELYGASLYGDTMKRGEEQIIVFRLQVANEKYLKDQTPLFQEALQLLHEVLINPYLEEGRFSPKFVQLEKDLLLRRIKQLKDDKMRYANMRCVEEMFAQERFRLQAHGSEEQLEAITAEDLFTYYQQLMKHAPMQLFISGDLEENIVQQALEHTFSLQRGETMPIEPTEVRLNVPEQKVITEKTKISQGKLHIGCLTGTSYADDDYVAMMVCNGIFGGFSHSKLFRQVREKESLAYYVASSIESHKGFMMIYSGVEFANYDKTVKIIKEQLEAMKAGSISEDELNQTKAMLINQLREANDQPYNWAERYMHGEISGRMRTADELILDIQRTRTEDVQQVANKIDIDTIYFLTEEA